MGVTFESICEKLGFNPLINPPKRIFKGYEDDSYDSPYSILSLEELELLCELKRQQLMNKTA